MLQRIRFRRALTLLLMTLVLPGSAQLVVGNKRVGRIAIRVWLGVWAVVGLVLRPGRPHRGDLAAVQQMLLGGSGSA